jgi:hypothetical protein
MKKALAFVCSVVIACSPMQYFSEPDMIMRKEAWHEESQFIEKQATPTEPVVIRKKLPPVPEPNRPVRHTKVPILMYHEIGEPGEYGERYTVSPIIFRRHLEWLDRNGYGLISIGDYISGRYKEFERKPVMLTFDDSTAGQFRYVQDGIDPECAVAILKDYSDKSPGFGHNAAFFIDFVDKQGNFQVPFSQKGMEREKLGYILGLGMEIGNHTILHTDMRKGKDAQNSVQFCDYLIELLAPVGKRYFAYPYGAMPEHKVMGFDCVFAAWGGVAPDIDSKSFDRFAIPRIEINNDFGNLEAYLK